LHDLVNTPFFRYFKVSFKYLLYFGGEHLGIRPSLLFLGRFSPPTERMGRRELTH